MDIGVTPDLPVIWWVFWLLVMGIVVFGALVWWLTREALRDDEAVQALTDGDRSGAHLRPPTSGVGAGTPPGGLTSKPGSRANSSSRPPTC